MSSVSFEPASVRSDGNLSDIVLNRSEDEAPSVVREDRPVSTTMSRDIPTQIRDELRLASMIDRISRVAIVVIMVTTFGIAAAVPDSLIFSVWAFVFVPCSLLLVFGACCFLMEAGLVHELVHPVRNRLSDLHNAVSEVGDRFSGGVSGSPDSESPNPDASATALQEITRRLGASQSYETLIQGRALDRALDEALEETIILSRLLSTEGIRQYWA